VAIPLLSIDPEPSKRSSAFGLEPLGDVPLSAKLNPPYSLSLSGTSEQIVSSIDGVEADPNLTNNTVANIIHVYTFDAFTPTLLTPIDDLVLNTTRPIFQWNAVPGAVTYEVQMATGNIEAAVPYSVTTNQYRPTSPLLTTLYNWRVRAVNAAHTYTLWSPVRHVTITASSNAAPIINVMQSSTPKLTWNRVSWAVGYEVEIAQDGEFNTVVAQRFVDADTLEFTPNEVLPNGTYFWHVCAQRDTTHCGTWSASQIFVVNYP
jgi:hypothetical protein